MSSAPKIKSRMIYAIKTISSQEKQTKNLLRFGSQFGRKFLLCTIPLINIISQPDPQNRTYTKLINKTSDMEKMR